MAIGNELPVAFSQQHATAFTRKVSHVRSLHRQGKGARLRLLFIRVSTNASY
jgi:hypothetical protein